MACTLDPEDSWPLWNIATHKLNSPDPCVPSHAGTRRDKAQATTAISRVRRARQGGPCSSSERGRGTSWVQATRPEVLALIHAQPEQGTTQREAVCCHLVPKLRGTQNSAAELPRRHCGPCFAPGLDWNNLFGLYLLFLRSTEAGEDRADQACFTPGGFF